MTQLRNTSPVLILDGDMVPALSITRSLSRSGLKVDIASHEPKPITGYSRYVNQKLTYPNPLSQEHDFIEWCKNTLGKSQYSLIIPVTERTIVPLSRLQNHANADKLAVPPVDTLNIALDKAATLELAQQLGIPAPRTKLAENTDQIAQAKSGLHLPIVIKPARSIGANQHGRKQLSVEYAFTEAELEAKTEHFLHYGPVLLQEYITGQGVGIELIADRGEIIYAFQHLRLHEVPLTGGGSSFRMSVPIEPELLDASKALMQALKWHGVAMIEFKWNPQDRTFALMEINGRFWGSLPLAIAAGADFPAMLYELLVERQIQARPPARTNIYCRKLSSDIYWLEQVLRKDAPTGLVQIPGLKAVGGDMLKAFSPRHYFDVQSWRDPLPGLVDLAQIAISYSKRARHLFTERRSRRAHRKAWQSGRAQRCLQQAGQILFLCYGNINRSALAERYFQIYAPEAKIKVISAGFHKEDGRPADPVMVQVAEEAGINMQNWVSQQLTPGMVATSDAILVMEQRHFEQLIHDFPDAKDKTFLLGMASENMDTGEIADPYGKPRPVYERCVREVTANVRRVADLIQATK